MKKIFLFCATILTLALTSCDNAPAKTPETAKSEAVNAETAKPSTTTASVNTAALLQGKWQFQGDTKSVFEIAGNDITLFYDGKKLDKRGFVFSADCSITNCIGGVTTKGCFSAVGDKDAECYTIVSISETDMETSFVAATDKTMKYKKIK
jgi:hypothetical protein